MTLGAHGFSQQLERSFKEVLFRFLEEVQCTKAALYLLGPEGDFLLTSQYGFGMRDDLAAEHRTSDPLAVKLRQIRSQPLAFNDAGEIPELASYLAGASTKRLLLVPLAVGILVVGFVDARDKGGRRPFAQDDVVRASRIGEALVQVIVQANLFPGLVAEPPRPTEHEQAPIPEIPGPVSTGQPEIDEQGLAEVMAAAAQLPEAAGVVAAVISLVEQDTATAVMLLREAATTPEHEVLFQHQMVALQQVGWKPVQPDAWRIEIRRVPPRAESSGTLQVASAVLTQRPGRCIVGSVLAESGSPAARNAMARLQRCVDQARETTELRHARRQLARSILQRNGTGYRELVDHSSAVSRLCWTLSAKLSLNAAAMEQAALAGLLHDVGMHELDYETVYRHPNPGPNERRQYQQHPVAGEAAVRSLGLASLAKAIRHHHERWDGQGYPDRLSGESIPLMSRLIHVAEVYDVLTAPHSYRRTLPPERALEIIRSSAGQQFDPKLVQALAGVVG